MLEQRFAHLIDGKAAQMIAQRDVIGEVKGGGFPT